MENKGLIPEPYSADAKGLYNRIVYEQTGEKFRPLDIHYGRLVVMTPNTLYEIAEHRNNQPGVRFNDREMF